MTIDKNNFISLRKSTKSIGVIASAAGSAVLGIAALTVAGTSTNTAGPVQAGTSDGNTTADYEAGNFSANNPAVTISFSGQTALRTFDTTPGITLLNPGSSIILHTGTNGAPVTYTAPAGNSTVVQLASSDFTSPDYIPDYNINNPTQTSTANVQSQSAIRLEWHEQGSVDGEYDLINDEVGYNQSSGPISNPLARGPSLANPTWINTNSFNGASGTSSTTNGFTLDYSSTDLLAQTYNPAVYNQANGVNIQGGQNRIQFSVGEYKTEGLSIGGTPSLTATAGSAGYGLGNPALRSATTYTGLGVAGVRQQFQPASIVNESTSTIDPQTGQPYPAGPWNTAGSDNINSTQVAVTAVGFSANPGTGLQHLNLADTQWLQTTGRLQNGAVFNFVSRTVDTGQRVVAALNTGIDPSWAVGTNDDGNTTITSTNPNVATQQHSVGPLLRFSGKTSGSEAEKTIASSRMAVGVLSLPETRAAASSAPVRNLDIDFNAADGFSSNASNFVHIDFNTIISSDPATRYQAILISQYNTIKAPNAAFAGDTAAQWAAAQTFDPSTAESDSTPAGTVTGIKGDTTGDVAAFISNIINSSGVGTAAARQQQSNGVVTLNNPADNLYSNGFLIPFLLDYTRTYDGGPITPTNYTGTVLQNQVTLQNAVQSTYGSLFTADGSAGASNETIGSGSYYGAGGAIAANGSKTINGTIPITAKDSSNNLLSDHTYGPGGNYLFGNFNQNGVRDLSAVEQAVNAALSLYAVDHAATTPGVNSIFTSDGGVPNSTVIPSLVGTPGWVTAGTNTKGDLIALGDYNGDGRFDGADLYELAIGASLADSTSTTTLTATYSTFADALRNPNDVLRKNAALDYFNGYLTYSGTTNASGGAAFLRKTAAAVLTSPSGVPRNATDLGTTDPITGLEQFSYDPTGNYAFDKHDVNRDGVVDFNDAVLVDQFSGQSYSNLNEQLAATEQSPVTGVVQSINLTVVQQIDGESTIGAADLAELNTGLSGVGNTNWYGYGLNKSGPGTITWARTGGTVTVYSGTSLQISSGTIHINSAVDPFTDSSATGTDTTKSLAISVTGGTLEYTGASTSGIQLDRLASLNVSAGQVVLDPVTNPSNRSLLLAGSLTLSGTGRIDLANNDLDIQSASLSSVTSAIAEGFNGGSWNGAGGITSSSAATSPTHLLALGVVQNNQSGTALFNGSKPFDGITPGAEDILVKSTYYGDANLDGKVDGSDYSRIDSSYLAESITSTSISGWYSGDFNYDGVVNGSDYTLIDNAYNSQGGQILNQIASPTAQVAGAAATSSVPEPTTFSLLAIGTTGLLGRRNRRQFH